MTQYTPIADISNIVASARSAFMDGVTTPLEFRKQQLRALRKCMVERENDFTEALVQDLKMNKILTGSEIGITLKEIDSCISNLDEWASPEKRSLPLLQLPGSGYVYREPLGVVLIIAPFNYPLTMITRPLVGAIAAGNCVIMKPSEVSVNTQNALASILPKYLDTRCYNVITGSVAETTELLKQKMDHIFYTGNGMVAKIILKAAAEYLTPVTLELGGKSPTIVDKNVNIQVAAERIMWGKFMNAGQTCIAPDYLFVHKDVESQFLEQCKKTLVAFFTSSPDKSADFGKLIAPRHFKRVNELLESAKAKGAKVFCGGDVNADLCYIAPTILTNVDPSFNVMQEEIFGPLLPVLTYSNIDEVIKFIRQRPKPLALYVFSNDASLSEKVITATSFGGGCINETLMHGICTDMPFGGVGESGYGAYNGKLTYELFTHRKTILKKSLRKDPALRFPPYTDSKVKWVTFLNKIELPKIKMTYPLHSFSSKMKRQLLVFHFA